MRAKLIVFLTMLSIVSSAQHPDWSSGGKLKPEQSIMDIRHYTLNLRVDPLSQSIAGSTTIDLILSQSAPVMLFDLVSLFIVEKVWVNGNPVSFTHQNDLIRIQPSGSINAGKVVVKIQYSGKPPVAERAPWDGGFQWAKDGKGNDWIAITCQNEGAKIYFPCKDHPSDEPNEGADLYITVPKGLVVAGPGLLQKVTSKKNNSTYHWKTNYTINTYSILFNVGKYKVVSRPYTTINGNKVPMVFYVLEENTGKANTHLELLERSARVLEKYFGEYPFVKEKIGIAETPHLGMEHQTMNAYGNKFNYTKSGTVDFDWLLHHEFGHEWWANKVTGKNYADMWIQEGICSFGDALFVKEYQGEQAYRQRMANTARSTQNVKPVVPGVDANSDEVYQGDIYGKGAFFMHTLRYIIGDSIFFPALLKFATDSGYTYDKLVTTDDVEQYFSKAASQNLKPLFDLFLRTTNKLEFLVKQVAADKYNIKLGNLEMKLPVEIQTTEGMKSFNIDQKGLTVESKSFPQIDPQTFYLKRVIYE